MKITKQRLKEIIKEELSRVLNEFQTEPELSFEYGGVTIKTGDGEFAVSVEEFLNAPTAVEQYTDDEVEVGGVSLEGRSIGIPKEMWVAAAEKLKGEL